MKTKCEACTDDHYEIMLKDISDNFGHDAKFCPVCGRCLEKPDFHKVVPVETIERGMPFEDMEESHPSFAQLSFHRYSGGHSNLYGSAIQHQQMISLQIKRSVKHVSPYDEKYYAYSSPLIEVHMSQAQFAEAITTLNMGDGVPVTLHSLRGEYFPKCPETNQAQKANNDLRDKLNEFADKISAGQKEINEILNKKGAINKGERKKIADIYGMLIQDLRSNLPFLHECMTEAFNKTTTSAKADIEAFYINAVNRLGMEALNQKKRLSFDKCTDNVEEAEIIED
jgi:hypothetical protein